MLALNACGAPAEYPNRPITMIVPWGAGGGTDAVARTLASVMEQELGKPINVVNRVGGSGVVRRRPRKGRASVREGTLCR